MRFIEVHRLNIYPDDPKKLFINPKYVSAFGEVSAQDEYKTFISMVGDHADYYYVKEDVEKLQELFQWV